MKKYYIDARFLKISAAKGINRYIAKYLEYTQLPVEQLQSSLIKPFSLLDPLFLSLALLKKNINTLLIPSMNVPLMFFGRNIVLSILDFISADNYKKTIFSFKGLLQRIYYQWYLPWRLKKVASIVTISEHTKSQILARYNVDPNKIVVAYPGVDEAIFYPEITSETKKKYFFAMFSNERVLEHKNITRIIAAFERFCQNRFDVDLIILGKLTASRKNGLLNTVTCQNQIKFVANISDSELRKYYSHSISLVYPSLVEGFGLPIIEAMACGAPVITSNIASMQEVGANAVCFVNPNSVDEIFEAMRRIEQDEPFRNALVQKGYLRVRDFSWRNMANKIDMVLRQ